MSKQRNNAQFKSTSIKVKWLAYQINVIWLGAHRGYADVLRACGVISTFMEKITRIAGTLKMNTRSTTGHKG